MFNTDYYNSRYFNNIEKQDDILIKSSDNIEKIKSEYDYYYFLPKNIQRYFVQPFDFQLKSGIASYKMEYIDYPNLARVFESKYVKSQSFLCILNKIDNFKNSGYSFNKKTIIDESKYLVLEKTQSRINGSQSLLFSRIDKAFKFYFDKRQTWNKVVSHGDLCFSNIIWIEESSTLKMIDPRGAKKRSDIFMDEYYDLAKLSHSIFGGYESIIYDTNINYDYITNIFLKYLKDKNISIELLKVYEASLFLSMTPLHIDNKEHIEKFLFQCDKILKEIGF